MINTIEETKKSINCKTLDGRSVNGWNKLYIKNTFGININAYLYFNKLLDVLEVI
ncbi:putative phage protein [Oenococcus oeni AWRIB422]|nr:putative phage protein [Oenococcus oeni AWRIB422]